MWLADTLMNLVSGIGTGKDKLQSNSFVFVPRTEFELISAYRGDWMAGKIVDIPADDMTREWRSWKADQDQIKKIEKEEKRLGLHGKVKDAITWARLYGGSAIVLGFGDADPTKPAPTTIKAGGLKYINVVNRHEITPGEIIRDVLSPWFGEPEYWQLNSSGGMQVRIHPSRVVGFVGAPRPDRHQNSEWWGDSVLERAYDAVNHAATADSGVAGMLQEAKLDIVRIPGLSENLSTEAYADRLAKRFTLASTLKSTINTVLLDAEEEWQQKQISFSQLPETMREFMIRVSAAADIPVTRFFGQSPAGLNSTGESDMRNYYDRLSGDQKNDLSPRLTRLDDAIIFSALGSRPDEIWYAWNPLWQQSEKEKAETDKITAETAAIYAKTGLVPSEALAKGVQNRLVEDGTYPGLEEGLKDAESALELEPIEEEPEGTPGGNTPGTTGDAAPRTLYVSRKVKNAADILKWAKSQGFKKTLTADDLHVTIAFSKTPLDWMKTGQAWDDELKIPAGGARIVEPLGPKGAVVLLFNSSELAWRHKSILRAGASWDWPDYQPHITITYDGKDMDLSKVEPYRGEIVLGPEIFQEVVEDWDESVKEA